MIKPAQLVRITDVAPRDGLQNEARIVSAADKARLVELLCAARVDEVEVTSFVSPKWVPQLGDAAQVLELLAAKKPAEVAFSVLVPNEQGMTAALAVNQRLGRVIDKVSVFTSASETFSLRNTNATIAQTLERFKPVIAAAGAAGLPVRGYVSCAVQCPFEGPIAPAAVARVARQLVDIGVAEVDVADTIGVGTAETVGAMLEAVLAELGAAWLPRMTLHMHDTFGRAADCVARALALGLRSFDGSAGGLGGCPYASTPERRAPGNIATLTLLDAVAGAGFETRVQRGPLIEAGAFARGLVHSP